MGSAFRRLVVKLICVSVSQSVSQCHKPDDKIYRHVSSLSQEAVMTETCHDT